MSREIVKFVRKSNDLVEARYKFDIWETRLFTKMLTMINMDDEDFKDYRIYLRDIVREFELVKNKESYELLLMIFQNSSKLPKNYKYTLGERLKNEVTEVLVSIFEASQSKDKNKAVAIQKALNAVYSLEF